MPRALIVDDQARVARALEILLDLHGFDCVSARTPEAALETLASVPCDVVLQDMNFSPGATDGVEGERLFRQLRAQAPGLPVLLITAWGSLESAVRLMKEGAADYLEKPWEDDDLVERIHELLSATDRTSTGPGSGAAKPAQDRQDDLSSRFDLCGMVYSSDSLREVLRLATRVASSDVSVLLTGPNGTGKEKVAEVIQANSPRRDAPFVKVDVGALPDTLLEAELFGAEPGAFTGADKLRIGRFEAANGGTILLDEIGNLSPVGQMKLLRALESGEIQRLGSSRPIRIDVRVLAATNADLGRRIENGEFRQDLYFRLAVLELELPPLHQRGDEVLLLADHFLALERPADGSPPPRFDPAARRALAEHSWPGNVRELHNAVRRALALAEGPDISPTDLGLGVADGPPATTGPGPADTERQDIEAALLRSGGVVSAAARSLGLSRQALYRRMEKLGIVLERKPRS